MRLGLGVQQVLICYLVQTQFALLEIFIGNLILDF